MWFRKAAACLLSLVWLYCLLAGAVSAQENAAEAKPEETKAEEVKENSGRQRTIYLPFSNLGQAFRRLDTDVVIPYAEYRDLVKAHANAAQRTSPPAVISQADYVVVAEENLARITAKWKVQVLRDGWSQLPFSFGNAAIGSVTVPDGVLLQGTANGTSEFLFPRASEYAIEIQLATRIHQSPESRDVTFDCPPVALTTLQVTVPGKDQKIKLNFPVASSTTSDETQTQFTAAIGARSNLSIQWRGAESLKPAMDLLTSVNNQSLVTIADGLVHTETWLNYSILRGELDQTRIVLPKTSRLLDVVSDQGISNWSTEVQGNNQVVTVKLPRPVNEKLQVTVRTESKLEESEFTVIGMSADRVAAGIHALDAVRESGQIAIRVSPDLSVSVISQHGLVRIQQEEAESRLVGKNQLYFKFYSPQVALRLSAKPMEPRVSVESIAKLTFDRDELEIDNFLNYSVEQAGLFELSLKVPDGVVIDRVQSSDLKEFNFDSNSRLLTVNLKDRSQGKIAIEIRSHLPLASDSAADIQLPLLEPLGVEREQGKVLVFSRSSIEIQALQSGVEAAQPAAISAESTSGETKLASAWTFTRRPVAIPVRVVHKPTRLQARQGTTIKVDQELVHVTSRINFQIDYAGQGEFRMEVPEAVSSRLQIEVEPGNTTSAPIKQKSAGAAENGKVIWTILTQRDVLGSQVFLVNYDLPLPTAQAGSATGERTLQLDLIRPLGTVNSEGAVVTPLVEFQGEVSVTKDRTLSINATSSGSGVEQIDPRELKLLPQDGTLAFRYYRDDAENPVAIRITTSRFDIQDVVDTVVTRGLIEVVTSEDRAATYRCRYLVKSSERQRLLVALPVDLEVLGAFVNDREVKLEKANTDLPKDLPKTLTPFWINIARPESSETSFLLTFQFLWNLPESIHERFTEDRVLNLPLPVISGGSQGVVQELKVVIYVPEELALVGDAPPFLIQKRRGPLSFLRGTPTDHRVQWLQHWVTGTGAAASNIAELPTEGRQAYVFSTLGGAHEITARVWNKIWMTLLFSGALALIGWILSSTSWENKIGLLMLFGFAAVLYGLRDSHGLAQGLHAARYGLALLLLMWVIKGISGWFKSSLPATPHNYQSTNIPYAVIPPPGVFDRLKPDSGG